MGVRPHYGRVAGAFNETGGLDNDVAMGKVQAPWQRVWQPMTTGQDGAGRQVTLSRGPGPAGPGRRVAADAECAGGGVAQLTGAGHHRIGFIVGTAELFTAAERVRGYQHVLANGVVTLIRAWL